MSKDSDDKPNDSDDRSEFEATRVNPTIDLGPQLTSKGESKFGSKYSRKLDPQQGGMAIVWRAFDSRLQREVAYKEIRPEHSGDTHLRAMFLHEAQVTGQLEHPNIIPIYELGDLAEEDRPFYTMRYISGQTLTEVIRDHHEASDNRFTRTGLSGLLNIFLKVANAIAYAHSRGVVHRDLKSDNIMVGKFGEVLVLDWGLAKVISANETDLPTVRSSSLRPFQTEAGVRKGTPAYWAPEQQQGQVDLIDQRTDVYGLGAVLYEIITNSAPHANRGDQTDSSVSTSAPAAAREVHRFIPSPLESICTKALSRKRSQRYSTANEMIRDVENYLVDEPVSAHRESIRDRVLRHVRRNQLVSLLGLIGSAVVLMMIVAFYLMQDSQRASLMSREIRALSAFASEERTELSANVESLRQDVTFLGTLDLVGQMLSLQEQTSSSTSFTASEPISPVTDHPSASSQKSKYDEIAAQLQSVFLGFLSEKLDYVQVRLLDHRGQELIRVERRQPAEEPQVIAGSNLQNKADRPYFKQAIATKRGAWFLSTIELNQEGGQKQKDLPVIRGAVPIFADEQDRQPSGILILNLHFQELVKSISRYRSNETSGLVYLTDEAGRFLYHPDPDLAFSFERGLGYQIQQLYPRLQEAYQSGHIEKVLTDQQPQSALWIRPVIRSKRQLEIANIHELTNRRLRERLMDLEVGLPRLKWQLGQEGEAVVYGVSEEQLQKIDQALTSTFGVTLETTLLPRVHRNTSQTVHFNRLPLEFGDESRFLALTLVVSDDSVSTNAQLYVIFVLIVTGIVIVIIVVTYLLTNRGPRGHLAWQ